MPAGAPAPAPAERQPTVLFVCLGNLCRSPMAAGLLERGLAERGLAGRYRVRSAGTAAREGDVAPPHAVRVAAERGVNLSAHLATLLTAELLARADLVVAMDRSNAEDILNLAPDLGSRLRLLNQFAREATGFDIPDPMGYPPEAFRESYRMIAAGVEGLLEALARKAPAATTPTAGDQTSAS